MCNQNQGERNRLHMLEFVSRDLWSMEMDTSWSLVKERSPEEFPEKKVSASDYYRSPLCALWEAQVG